MMEASISISIIDQHKYLLIHLLRNIDMGGIAIGMVEKTIIIEKRVVTVYILRIRLLLYLFFNMVDNIAEVRILVYILLKVID
jgi:hypothetical protein